MDRRSFYRPSFIQPVLGSLTTEQVKKEVSRRVTSPSESWPLWSSSSPITFHVCSFADGPGTDQRVCPPRPSPIRPLAGQGVFPHPDRLLRRGLLTRLPMPFLPEGVMHIDARIEIGLRFIATDRAAEQLATPMTGAALPRTRKPFSSGSTPTAVLAGSMRIDFTRHHPHRIRFVLRVVSDFPFELVGLLAIEPPGLTHGSRLHLAQARKPAAHNRDTAHRPRQSWLPPDGRRCHSSA